MSTPQDLLNVINAASPAGSFIQLYGKKEADVQKQKDRYRKLVQRFQTTFPDAQDLDIFSSPGRTEVGGNHTDHNAGRVLAAAVNLDILAAVSVISEPKIIIDSEGYRRVQVDINRLEVVEQEKYSPAALVRGVCARMKQLGYTIGGFRACLTSNVPNGSGLSSSAAFEVMIVTILNELYNQGRIGPIQAALIAQFAENHYFGKPSGLMDQTTCAVGGFVTIDFQDNAHPQVHKLDVQFGDKGYSLAIIGTGGSHADLNEDYAAIESEMKSVARTLGGRVLREISREMVLDNIAMLREKVNDRAILRALHFFNDDARVALEVQALESGDFNEFLRLVIESGHSSWMMNQNVFTTKNPLEQGVAVALAMAETVLAGRGAWRVHGGGFAGTIQAFVPEDLVPQFMDKMAAVFGQESCHLISIRPVGAVKVNLA